MTDGVEFSPEYVRKLMPSSAFRSEKQLLKSYKNAIMHMCEETAKCDKKSCVFTLSSLDVGAPPGTEFLKLAFQLADWLKERGFGTTVDENTCSLEIDWSPKSEPTYVMPLQQQKVVSRQRAGNHPFLTW